MLSEILQNRKKKNKMRILPAERNDLIDFCSNDYLGFAQSSELKDLNIRKWESFQTGSTGSRLLTGNSELIERLETEIAAFHHAQAGLIFNSGYCANIGLMSSVPQTTDVVLYDEHIHASIHDGMRLSRATCIPFRHNDVENLLELLQRSKEKKYVVVESVYSGSGDIAPLNEILSLKIDVDFELIVDEAHATGIYGTQGEGRVVELGLQNQVFARLHTFGKALGCFGSIVLCDDVLKEYLVNYARSFIYTTALPPMILHLIESAYSMLPECNQERKKLRNLSNLFDHEMEKSGMSEKLRGVLAIKCLNVTGNINVKRIMNAVMEDGYDVRALIHPTVPLGKEQLRICLHSFNSADEVINLVTSIRKNI